jgi:type IV pilus assembly protein PilQ
VKRLLGFQSWLLGGALVALATQPVHAAATTITGVRVVPTGSGVRITLNTEGGDAPQVFAINQGSSLRADIVRTQLRLDEGTQFYQQSPAPGIDSIALVPLDANSVRLTVNSSGGEVPAGTIAEADSGGIVIDVNTNGSAAASTPVPTQLETVPGEPQQLAQTPDQPDPAAAEPVQAPDQPDVLVPSPEVTIDGVPFRRLSRCKSHRRSCPELWHRRLVI